MKSLVLVESHKSISAEPLLPRDSSHSNFLVISGPNGAGKSQLLEAIRDGSVRIISDSGLDLLDDGGPNSVRLVTHQDLDNLTSTHSRQFAMPGTQPRYAEEAWQRFEALRNGYLSSTPADLQSDDGLIASSASQGAQGLSSGMLSMLKSMIPDASLLTLTLDNFNRVAPRTLSTDSLSATVSEIVHTYEDAKRANLFSQYLAENHATPSLYLTEKEFELLHGPNPVDQFNNALQAVGLPYSFEHPPILAVSGVRNISLIHSTSGLRIDTGALSSGEKTLLALVVLSYTTADNSGVFSVPRVLLLDEADSRLHPSAIPAFLRLIDQKFVQDQAMVVFLVTHSATTVALAPHGSLLTMSRDTTPRLNPVSRDAAIGALTVGLTTLRVHVEDRVTVFVEAKLDQFVYQELARHLAIDSSRTLEFLSVAKADLGDSGGRSMVNQIVRELRNNGIVVHGLVDRDNAAPTSPYIHCIDDRYALENLVLDPLAVGVLLLQHHKVTNAEVGLHASTVFRSLDAAERQTLCLYVANRAVGPTSGFVEVSYHDGVSVDIPSAYLEMRGHDLAETLLDKILPLRSIVRSAKALSNATSNDVDCLVRYVVDNVFASFPSYIPGIAAKSFAKILAAVH